MGEGGTAATGAAEAGAAGGRDACNHSSALVFLI